jgi:hypothetical protein
MVLALLGVGAKVRVLGGPFAGRVGVISELDGKGGARVTLGLMSARVMLEDLRSDPAAAHAQGRPSLKSSHRHPDADPPTHPTDVRSAAARSKKSRPTGRTPPK